MVRLVLAVTLAASVAACSSESVNNTAPASGGTAGGTGATGGSATGGTGGTSGAGGSGGSAAGDAGVDAEAGACAFQGDAGDIGKWPDSKTKWCSGAGCVGGGEDGDYVLNPPAYTVSGNVVKDLVTGLEWRKDVIEQKLWAEAGPACAALDSDGGGGAPWRLPTRVELMSLLDFGTDAKLLQPSELDSPSLASTFWTSTEASGNPTAFAWVVNFNIGSVGGMTKTGALSSLSVRCVRGTARASKLEVNASCEVVSDTGTGLMWFRPAESAKYEWPAALAHCQGLTHAGFDDWRLPSAKELMTIVLDTASQPAIDKNAFVATPAEGFWSSTPRRADPKSSQVVDFGTGAEFFGAATTAHHARCVRSLL